MRVQLSALAAAAVLASATGSAHALLSSTADLGTLTSTPTKAFSLVELGLFGVPILGTDKFVFDLSKTSNVYVDLYTVVNASIAGSFTLFDNEGTNLGKQFTSSAQDLGTVLGIDIGLGPTSVDLFSHKRLTFSNLLNGNDYKLVYNPGLVTVGVFDKVAFSAAPAIPEPSTYALMGLGLLGVFAARRRHSPSA